MSNITQGTVKNLFWLFRGIKENFTKLINRGHPTIVFLKNGFIKYFDCIHNKKNNYKSNLLQTTTLNKVKFDVKHMLEMSFEVRYIFYPIIFFFKFLKVIVIIPRIIMGRIMSNCTRTIELEDLPLFIFFYMG